MSKHHEQADLAAAEDPKEMVRRQETAIRLARQDAAAAMVILCSTVAGGADLLRAAAMLRMAENRAEAAGRERADLAAEVERILGKRSA